MLRKLLPCSNFHRPGVAKRPFLDHVVAWTNGNLVYKSRNVPFLFWEGWALEEEGEAEYWHDWS